MQDVIIDLFFLYPWFPGSRFPLLYFEISINFFTLHTLRYSNEECASLWFNSFSQVTLSNSINSEITDYIMSRYIILYSNKYLAFLRHFLYRCYFRSMWTGWRHNKCHRFTYMWLRNTRNTCRLRETRTNRVKTRRVILRRFMK